MKYKIACALETGPDGWDVVEVFNAPDEDTANGYAENFYAGEEWYVLDATGRNINGGNQ